MHRAESSVIYWIINKIIEREGRAELFRSLGRGWIFILLRRPQRKFKWWFEGVNRVIRNHQSDIKALNLPEGGLEKYTQGYVCQSEIVFLMKGLTPTRIVPIISIQKMANDFEHLHKWATNEDARKAVQTPFPTDEERQAHAAKAQKRQERNRREKEKKRERAKRAKEERAKEEEKAKQGEQAQEEGRATAGEAEAAAGGVAGSEDDDDAVAGVVGAGAPTAAGLSDPEEEEEEDDDDEEDDGGGFASRGGLLDEGASLSFEAMLAAMKAEDAMASPAVEVSRTFAHDSEARPGCEPWGLPAGDGACLAHRRCEHHARVGHGYGRGFGSRIACRGGHSTGGGGHSGARAGA